MASRKPDDLVTTRASYAATPRKRPHGAQEYRGNGSHNWEPVSGPTQRLRVPGGWLYAHFGALTFVPVPEIVGYVI